MSPPPPGMGGAFSFSGFSATTASVVRNRAAIDAAFCRAERVTLVGSMMPALNMSSYSPVAALRPNPTSSARTFSITTPPSRPAVRRILFDRPFERPPDDERAGELVAVEIHLVQRRLRVQQGDAAARH